MNAAASTAEAAFEALSEWVAKELAGARGSIAETAILEEAVRRYAVIRRGAASDAPYENVVHFLGADGVGLAAARTPAFQRVPDGTEAEVIRWSELAGEHARRMESDEIKARGAAKA